MRSRGKTWVIGGREAWPQCEAGGSGAGVRSVLRAANQVATAGRRLPDPPGEGWHRVQEVLEAPRAHEQDLGVGGHDGDVGLASPAFQQAQFAEDVALAQLADTPALGPDREVARQEEVEPVGLVSLDEDVLALLELLDPAEDCEAGELTRGHVLDHAPGPRLQRRLESGALLSKLQAWQHAPDLADPLLDLRVLPDQPAVLLLAEPNRLGGAVSHHLRRAETALVADSP